MLNTFVFVLLSIHTVWPAHHPDHAYRVKDYQSTFSTQDKCVAALKGMNQADPSLSWYCERHIVE